MLLRGLVLSLLLFFLPLGFGHIPKYQRRERRHSRPHVLHPTVHPDVDRTDPKHIRANEGLTLHYHDPHAAFPEIRSFASVHVSGFRHPAVLLEHSIYVASTQCETDPSTITVAFKHRPAWEMALKDWQQHPKFMLVAFEDSCGLGRESGERSVHLVHNITAISNTLEIIGHMSELSLTDAIHPDREVAIDVDTYDVHNTSAPFAPSHLTRRDNGDTTAGGDDSDSSLGKSSSGSSTSKWPSPDSTSSTATDQPTARPDSIAPVNNGEMANGSDIDARPESGNGDGNAQPSSPHSIPDTNGTSPPPDFTNETNEDSVSNFDLYGFNHAGNLWNVPPATEENEDAAVMELIQQQHAKDDIDGYWTMDELLGADAQHTLLPEAIDSGSDNSLSTRIGGDCGSAFDPVSLLIDCVALPVSDI
ncbi:hypothetical protein C8R43DRAFT_316101 [Mycena crocata]|nr:hypothetical protein C8R43DRAFT_316101 [Mycena crocata]